jgi:hypothetical protein
VTCCCFRRESTEVLRVDAERHAGTGLRPQHLQDCVVGAPKTWACVVASSV